MVNCMRQNTYRDKMGGKKQGDGNHSHTYIK